MRHEGKIYLLCLNIFSYCIIVLTLEVLLTDITNNLLLNARLCVPVVAECKLHTR